jgi:two-component system, cell cycle response regulator DivK
MSRQKRILIVEDNSDARNLLALVLSRSGYDIIEAATGLDAIHQAHAGQPDLIIMDLSLPEMNGDEATVRLKADASTRHIPVVVNRPFTQTRGWSSVLPLPAFRKYYTSPLL